SDWRPTCFPPQPRLPQHPPRSAKQKSPDAATPGLRVLRWRDAALSLGHLKDRLRLNDHQVLVEQVEAVDLQLLAVALDVEHAEEPAHVPVALRLAAHQLPPGGVADDFLLGRLVQRLRE